MRNDCPVVCSNAGSLSEIVGDAALTTSPDAVDTMAALCLRLLREPQIRRKHVRAGQQWVRQFNMEIFANGLLQTYEKAKFRHE
jgi:glycosyltransferase involved in cell wall biosynthesis